MLLESLPNFFYKKYYYFYYFNNKSIDLIQSDYNWIGSDPIADLN